jgi:asparagine synthase (glutamine-hydrolysing)
LVSQLTRRHVTVALSGDGGDELFGGYDRYSQAYPLWQRARRIPLAARRALGSIARMLPPRLYDSLLGPTAAMLGVPEYRGVLGNKVHKLAGILGEESPEGMYRRLTSHWTDPTRVVRLTHEPDTVLSDPADWPSLVDFRHRMMALDMVSYLPNDILTKVDRASMAVGLEARVPLLDHRVAEFAWRVPISLNFRDGKGKWLLRQVLHRYVPQELVERPKMGFGIPIGAWLRGPLRQWADALLDEGRLRRETYLNPSPIRRAWLEHLAGRGNWQYLLWDVLMFQAWLERWGTRRSGAAA